MKILFFIIYGIVILFTFNHFNIDFIDFWVLVLYSTSCIIFTNLIRGKMKSNKFLIIVISMNILFLILMILLVLYDRKKTIYVFFIIFNAIEVITNISKGIKKVQEKKLEELIKKDVDKLLFRKYL